MKANAIVIGAGIGGIAIAIRLKHLGFNVKVYEKSAFPGGKITEFRQDGFRFDMGPSLFTLPQMVEELLSLHHETEPFLYSKLDTVCRYFYPDGTVINAWEDPQKFADELFEKTDVPAKQVADFLDRSSRLYDITAPLFIFRPFQTWRTVFSRAMLNAALNCTRLKLFTTMHAINHRYFGNPKVVQLFDRYATYNGSNPYKAPGTLNVIPHLEHNIGAWFPHRGMHSIVETLYHQAKNMGVEFVFQTPVTKITTLKSKVTGVITNKGIAEASVVVSNCDVSLTYDLLEKKIPRHYAIAERSTSALIFYWGMKGSFPQLDVHNVLFSANYKHEFDCLFKKQTISFDPTVYLFISSKKVISDAPPGCENWFVMVNAPQNNGQNWDELIRFVRTDIKNKISKRLGIPVDKHLLFERVLDPRGIELRTSSLGGSLYGNSSNSILSAFNRHPNFFRSIEGMYCVGGSVHPGGGIPLCLASAKIVQEWIEDQGTFTS